MKKADVIAQFKSDLNEAKKAMRDQVSNTEKCIAFYNGDSTFSDSVQFKGADGKKKMAVVQFNKIKQNIDSVVGFIAQNRSEIKYMARSSSPIADIFTRYKNALAGYIRENAFMDHIETEQDMDMLINGYGVTDMDISYILGGSTNDPNGEIAKYRIDPQTVLWDFSARQKNVNDTRYRMYSKEFDLRDAVDLFSEDEDKFEEVVGDGVGEKGYQFNPNDAIYTRIREEGSAEFIDDKKKNRVRVWNYQFMRYENFYRADNPLYSVMSPQVAAVLQSRLEYIASQAKGDDEYSAGDMFSFDPKARILTFDDALKPLVIEQLGEFVKPVKFKRRCYYTAIMSGEHCFKWFKSLSQQGFSIKIKTGTFDAHNGVWVGMVNSMMEPQRYYNKAVTELLFTIASNSKGGVMVEKSAVTNINDFSAKWAKTDAVIVVEDGAITQGKIQEKGRATVPTGLENIITLTDAAVSDSSGIDRAFLGAREDGNESGIAYRRRIKQVVSTIARYMDSIAMYQKDDARTLSDFIRVWVQNNDGSLVRVTGEDGVQEFMQISSDKLVDEYDVTMREAPQTPEEKQETAALLSGFGDKVSMTNPQAASAFYLESIKLMNVDGDVEKRLTDALQPKDEVSPQQVAQLQVQMQSMQAMIDQLNAYIEQGNVRKTMADAMYTEAKAKTELARAVEVAESADNKALENDIIRDQSFSAVSVSI